MPTKLRHTKNKVGVKDPAIVHYLEFTESVMAGIQGRGSTNQDMNELYSVQKWLDACKIVEVPAEMYVGLYEGADRFTTEEVAGFTFQPPSSRMVDGPDGKKMRELCYGSPPPDEEVVQLMSILSDAHRLSLRGFAPYREGEEWLAVLVSVVGEHMKGPADKPYVPGKRVLDPAIVRDGLS